MALPMVHLLIAERWAQDKPELHENPEYYLGAISPDAIHVRDGNDKSRKNEIHLNNWRRPDPESVIRYWQTHFTPFDIGYGIHVLTDGQWAERFRADLPGILLPDGKPNPELYYNDTCVSDFELYNHSPHTDFLMRMIKTASCPDMHPLLTQAEFAQWRSDTLAFYRRECPMNQPVRFIDLNYIQRFMDNCMALLNSTYERMIAMNPTQKSIMERRSNRGYADTALSDAEMQNLMDAALAAPTARNLQEWHFNFVTNKALLQEFSAEFREGMLAGLSDAEKAAKRDYDVFFNAPLVVFITLPEQLPTHFAQVDAGIAVQSLALSAQGMDLGSVIIGLPKQVFDGPNGAQWEKRLQFEAGHHFAIAIAIGHPTVTKDAHTIHTEKITKVV